MILNIFSCPAQMDMKMNTNGQFFTNSFYQSHADLLELWSDLVYGNTDCGEDKKKKPWNDLFSVQRNVLRQGCSWVDLLWVTQGCSVITAKTNNQEEKLKEENHGQDILVAKEMAVRRGGSLPVGLKSSGLLFGDTRIQFSMKWALILHKRNSSCHRLSNYTKVIIPLTLSASILSQAIQHMARCQISSLPSYTWQTS